MQTLQRQQLERALPELRTFWSDRRNIDWRDPRFDLVKAYHCAGLASLAYSSLGPLELGDDSERIKVIPSDLFRVLATQRMTLMEETLTQLDMPDSLIIQTKMVVMVAICIEKVVFVLVRGTANLHDVLVDLNFPSKSFGWGRGHRGFVDAAEEPREKLQAWLNRHPGTIRYVVGHSLGGAIAALMFLDARYGFLAGYVFGTPRLGSREVVAQLAGRPLHSVTDKHDLVPRVPPAWLGFFGLKTVLETDFLAAPTYMTGLWVGLLRLLTPRQIRGHSIEGYRASLAAMIAIVPPPNAPA